jgi:outer membrane protein assembly factor BamB
MIFQPSADGHIYVVDLTGKQALSPIKTGGDAIWAQPVTNPGCGCIYIASMDHMVYSFDLATGRQLWVSQDLGGSMVDTPAVGTEGTIYVGTFGDEMIALDSTNGTVKWRFTTEDWVWSGPALANNVLYFGDLSGTFYALDPSNGRELWRIQPNNSIVDSPVVSGDNIYFTTEADTLYSLNPAGAIVYSKVIGGVIYSSPVIVGDTILVAPTSFDAVLVALTLDGNQKWTFTPAK